MAFVEMGVDGGGLIHHKNRVAAVVPLGLQLCIISSPFSLQQLWQLLQYLIQYFLFSTEQLFTRNYI